MPKGFSYSQEEVDNFLNELEEIIPSVSLSQDGSNIAIGAPYHSEGGDMTKSGRSYVYREVQESEWIQVGHRFSGTSSNELFGWSPLPPGCI